MMIEIQDFHHCGFRFHPTRMPEMKCCHSFRMFHILTATKFSKLQSMRPQADR